jgi:hypothetical protein
MMPPDPQSFTLGFTGAGLADHFDIKASTDRTPRSSGDNAARLLTGRAIALAAP